MSWSPAAGAGQAARDEVVDAADGGPELLGAACRSWPRDRPAPTGRWSRCRCRSGWSSSRWPVSKLSKNTVVTGRAGRRRTRGRRGRCRRRPRRRRSCSGSGTARGRPAGAARGQGVGRAEASARRPRSGSDRPDERPGRAGRRWPRSRSRPRPADGVVQAQTVASMRHRLAGGEVAAVRGGHLDAVVGLVGVERARRAVRAGVVDGVRLVGLRARGRRGPSTSDAPGVAGAADAWRTTGPAARRRRSRSGRRRRPSGFTVSGHAGGAGERAGDALGLER